MNRLLLPLLSMVFAAPLLAVDVSPALDRAVRDSLAICAGATLSYEDLPIRLPERFTGAVVRVESAGHDCDTRLVAAVSPTGGTWVGSPWPLAAEEGTTAEEKLKAFAWRALRQHVTVEIDRKRTSDGLFKATLWQVTESGKMPLQGEIDPAGTVFFLGGLRPAGTDVRKARLEALQPHLQASPSKGATSAPVTIVEFSDFQCPSCQRAAGWVDPILAAHGEKVRYVRYDLPLQGHSWAFGASLAGRAIHRQKPELFWEYKKQVYANQSSMNPLMFWDWARRFAEDNELDLARYDADLASEALKSEVLAAAGAAFGTEVRGTPTYLVNGVFVEPGDEGKALAEYVAGLVAR